MELRNPRQLHRKLFYTYTVVVVLVAAGLMLFFVTTIRRRNYDANMENARRIQSEAMAYLTAADETAAYFHGRLYQSRDIMVDLENFLTDDTEDYIRKRLNNYAASNSLQGENIYSFVDNAFSLNHNLTRIELISYQKQDITFCYPDKTVYPSRRFSSRLEEILENKAWTENEFYFRREIQSLDDQRPLGCMVFVFDVQSLEELMEGQEITDLVITNQNGSQVWGTVKYDGGEFEEAAGNGTLAQLTDSFVENQSIQNYQIYTLLDKDASYKINLPTLEAIRMKAITNGDREVGKMLYSMAVTFRAQLKEKDVITLAQELHYCKKYMELFEYRYQGRFQCQVSCPEELRNCPIIKFVLQPLIENYFVHGIRMQDGDNRISIRALRRDERLCILIEDNGRGMEQEEIDRKNKMLQDNVYERQASIGIANVNRRVKAVYGQEFGVQLSRSGEGGVCVSLDIKYEEGEPDEEGNAG